MKAGLSAVIDDAVRGEPAIITRHGKTILSRNGCQFAPLGVPVLDPFAALPSMFVFQPPAQSVGWISEAQSTNATRCGT